MAGLSTTSSAYAAVKANADASGGTPDITCDQDERQHPATTLAAAMVYARNPTLTSYRTKAISMIEAARATAASCGNAILSLGRQLGAYILAADYVGYRDAGFVSWVSSVRGQNFGGHTRWYTLARTAANTSNNWGTFALASLTIADAYLRSSGDLTRDYGLWVDYGDGTDSFQNTGDHQVIWECPAGFEINPASCTDTRKEGAAVEDASRSTFPTLENYPAEAAQGYVVTAEVLFKAGFSDAWTVNTKQVCRNAKWRERGSNLNWSSADRYVNWMVNKRCGFSQPTIAAGYGRVFGYTDWLFG